MAGRFGALGAILLPASLLLASCGGGTPEEGAAPVDTFSSGRDSVIVMPASPMEVALQFSNLLAMNDPACLDLLASSMLDTLPSDSLSPRELFGTWRAFDADGRMTGIAETGSERRTSYYCTITRSERPAISRIDFLLEDQAWLIEGFAVEVPEQVEDSLTLEQLADLVLQSPTARRELRMARMLWDDCMIDSAQSYASLNAAMSAGADFREFITDLQPASYAVLAESNVRRGGKLQIIQDRMETQLTGASADLQTMANIVTEMALVAKSVLRERHEAMQELYSTGTWDPPDVAEDRARLAGFRQFFLSLSDLVEERDTLSSTWPAILTTGSAEPLAQLVVNLDPHQLEQSMVNDIGAYVWRSLAVEMNGDRDPERVLYWAGDLFLFRGTPTGYSLDWRTYEDYDSDYHAEFVSRPSAGGVREVTFVGNDGTYEYVLSYHEGAPRFTRTAIAASASEDSTGTAGVGE